MFLSHIKNILISYYRYHSIYLKNPWSKSTHDIVLGFTEFRNELTGQLKWYNALDNQCHSRPISMAGTNKPEESVVFFFIWVLNVMYLYDLSMYVWLRMINFLCPRVYLHYFSKINLWSFVRSCHIFKYFIKIGCVFSHVMGIIIRWRFQIISRLVLIWKSQHFTVLFEVWLWQMTQRSDEI